MNHFLDIFFIAAIAIFILYRLFKVLGQDVGFKPNPTQQPYLVNGGAKDSIIDQPSFSPLTKAIQEYKQYDPSFTINSFIEGAKGAFKLILQAARDQDLGSLSNLLSPDIKKRFESEFKENKKRQEVPDHSLIRIKTCELLDLKVERKKTVLATVKYVSEQILVVYNKTGQVIEGDPDQIETISEIWTFKRTVDSNDPNWVLVETKSLG